MDNDNKLSKVNKVRPSKKINRLALAHEFGGVGGG